MSLFGKIISKQIEKVKKSFKDEVVRIDDNWPLNFAIGRTVKVEDTPFISLGSDTLLGERRPDYSVMGCGKSKHSGMSIYTFYLEENDKIIVSIEDGKDEPHIEYYILWERVFPHGESDWDNWLNKHSGMLGWKDFSVDDVKYERVFPVGIDKVEPFKYDEKYTNDITGEHNIFNIHNIASYARKCGQWTEYLTIDNCVNKDNSYIDIYIGVDIPKEFLKVF